MAETLPITCGHCGQGVGAEVVAGSTGGVCWVRCPICGDGSVRSFSGAVYPTAPAGSAVENLPEDVELAWREVRTTHAVAAAYTASEMMCRKILLHLAVDKAGAKAGKGFVAYVDALDSAGYVAPGLKPVVDIVRTRGNGANHELPASTETDSLRTLKITEHLLHTIYELPGLAPTT